MDLGYHTGISGCKARLDRRLDALTGIDDFAVGDVDPRHDDQRHADQGIPRRDLVESEVTERRRQRQVGILERRHGADIGNLVGPRQQRPADHADSAQQDEPGQDAEGKGFPTPAQVRGLRADIEQRVERPSAPCR